MKNDYIIEGSTTRIIVNSKRHGRQETLIDTEDLERVKELSSVCVWYNNSTKTLYAKAVVKVDGKWNSPYLHRYLMNVNDPKEQVDHLYHNTLDNRKSKLQIVSHAENNQNRSSYSLSASGITGVSWEKRRGKWLAQIMINGKTKFLGYHGTKESAAQARLKGELKYFKHKTSILQES